MLSHLCSSYLFFFNDTPTTEIYTLSLHDALPILMLCYSTPLAAVCLAAMAIYVALRWLAHGPLRDARHERSEEHTSELQSQSNLVCRLLLEKKKKKRQILLQNHVSRVRSCVRRHT